MNTKKIFSWLLFLFGEAIIIIALLLPGGNVATNILVLNIVVASVIYGLFFIDILVPWVNFNDKSQRRIGSLGVRWFATWWYAILAIAVMVLGNAVYEFSFATQLVIHFILFFFLLLGLYAARCSSDKVNQVAVIETANRNGLLEMKKAMLALKNKINETTDLPDTFIQRVDALEESLRFISPTGNSEAHELERSFVETINTIRIALTDYSLNEQQIENNLKKCERLYQNRKNIYSN
jgi:hypothetical protein